MKKLAKYLVGALTVVLLCGIGSIAVYAAVNSQTITKVGDQYVVDTVVAETTADGITVQSIERKYIPENRYNPNDPRNPLPSGTTPVVSDKVTQLRNAAATSLSSLQSSAYSYQWGTTFAEASASDSELHYTVTFQVDASVSADRWVCTFDQVTKFNSSGTPYVEYYIGAQKYSVAAINRMFAKYGRAR
jgi:hypothetical protein